VNSLDAILSLKEGPARTCALVAWIQNLFGEDVPILVGGAAVELYSGGGYRTGDLDFVGTVSEDAAKRLEKNGFERRGRYWIREQGEVFVEFPSAELAAGEVAVEIELHGTTILAISPEDLVVDRLAAWQFWNSEQDALNAFLIARSTNLDARRLRRNAGRRRVLGSLKALTSFLQTYDGADPTPEEMEQWARASR